MEAENSAAFLDHRELMEICASRMGSTLESSHERRLERWAREAHHATTLLVESFLGCPESRWTHIVNRHRAQRHPWYGELADRVSVAEFAAFLLENRWFPEFLPMLERVLQAQICDAGRDAVARNIAEEEGPVPHAELMRRMITALASRAGSEVPLQTFPGLVDRTLAFYYGYYRDPWHLVGALFVTEVLAYYRVTRMGVGLRRLGLEDADLEFIRVHSLCDEEHARDWIEGVIAPSVHARPGVRGAIAQGAALCLETSAEYLDHLVERARTSRAAA